MGYFTISSKKKLSEMEIGEKITESDFASLTPTGEFVQMKYVEEDDNIENIEVNPGIWCIQKTPQGMQLQKAAFSKDKILDSFIHTQDITDKIDCFFRNLHIYAEHGIEVPKRAMLLYGPPGCHAKDTEILMYDGSIKRVQNVKVGDLLMGPDSKPREVLKLARNKQRMVKISPIKGESFIVNEDHILHLTPSGKDLLTSTPVNMKFSDYVKQNNNFKERYKLTRTGVKFSKKELKIPPYILGAWLGDGTSTNSNITSMDSEIVNEFTNYSISMGLFMNKFTKNNSKASTYHMSKGLYGHFNQSIQNLKHYNLINNKHIPKDYLTSNTEDRLELLAGLIDTDGSLTCNGYDYITKLEILADNIVFLCRSLGLAAYKTECKKSCVYKGIKKEGTYYRISISGDIINVPVRIERKKGLKRKQIKNVLRTGFNWEYLPEDNYYGFTLDSDHLYLTSDFIIHHNTGKTSTINKVCEKYNDEKTAIIIWNTDKFEAYQVKDFFKTFKYKVDKIILVVEDIGGVEIDQTRMRSDSSLLSLLDNKEKTFKIPVLILATTNFPEVFMGNLTNRPERFDDKIEVGYPDANFRAELLKFYSKTEISENLLTSIKSNKANKLSAAHIREIVIRSRIYEKTMETVLNEIIKEIEHYEKAFSKQKALGMGFGD